VSRAGQYELYPGDTSSPGAMGVADGKVDFSDLTGFAAAYFTRAGDPGYRLKYDFGSAGTNSYYALPVSDGDVSFRDLVTFATGYTLSLERTSAGMSGGVEMSGAGLSGGGVTTPAGGASAGEDVQTDDETPAMLTIWLGEARPVDGESSGDESAGDGLFSVPVMLSGEVSQIAAMQLRLDGLVESDTDESNDAGANFTSLYGLERLGILGGDHGFAAFRRIDGSTDLVEVDAAVLGLPQYNLQQHGTSGADGEHGSGGEVQPMETRHGVTQRWY
jgi:hypothetical protein